MKVYDAQSLRNVALVGHSGAGKTQLVSTLLFDAGAVNRLGRVDDGTTVTDYDEEEISRKHTLSAALAYAEWNKVKINFIDTPGMANFLSDARAALRVADAALVVVDAVAGVEVSTEKVWSGAEELQVPRLIVLNRLDRERASLDRSVESLRGVFGRTVIPIQLPIGEEKSFRGIVDLVGMKAWTYPADGSGKASEGAVPAEMEGAANSAREALIEMVAEADDSLMEKFFDAGTLTQEELVAGLKRGIAAGRIFPVLCVVGHDEHRPAAADGRHRRVRAVAGGAGLRRRRCRGRGSRATQGGGRGAAGGVRLEDRRRSVRRTHHDVPGDLGNAQVGLDGAERHPRHGRAARQPGAVAGKDPDRGAGDQGRRPRRGGEAEGVADERPARRQVVQRPGGAGQVPGSRHLVRDRAEEPRRRREDQHLAAPAAGRGPDPELQPRRADQGAAAVGSGTVAHRSRGGEAEAPLRRRSEPEAAAHSLSGNDLRRRPKRTAATRNRPAATASSGTAR